MVFGDGTAADYVVGRHSSRPEFRSKGGGAILITGQAAVKMLHSTQDLYLWPKTETLWYIRLDLTANKKCHLILALDKLRAA